MPLGSGDNGQEVGPERFTVEQLEDDAVLGFAAAWAVIVDDLYENAEQRLPLATLFVADPGLDARAVRWVVGEEDLLQLSDRRFLPSATRDESELTHLSTQPVSGVPKPPRRMSLQ